MAIYLLTIIVILFISFGLPAIKRSSSKRNKAGKAVHRYARMYGSITLDGKTISDRQKGAVNPAALYSETNKAPRQ